MLKSKTLLLFIVVACAFAACKTDPAYDKDAQLAIDRGLIDKFTATNGANWQTTKDGLSYQILKAGSPDVHIDSIDTVVIHYVGRTLNQVLYDSTSNLVDTIASKLIFGTMIEGMQKGVRLSSPGGQIRLIIPSTMAYQNRVIPAMLGTNNVAVFLPVNSILDFNIKFFRVGKFTIKKPITTN